DSVHAAGVVIADAPLVNYFPLKLSKDSRDDSRSIVTQFDMHGVERLGLLKMDFLGLRNLSVIEDTVAMLAAKGVPLDIDHVPLDDQAVYEMLRRGDTTGVFQLEGAGMRSLIRQLAPDRFEDLMALVALYRPGPLGQGTHVEYAERKHGRRGVSHVHPDLESVLAPTYGVMVYQEQVMEVAVRLAGYTMGEADSLRHAIGKKKREEIATHHRKFAEGAEARGYDRRLVEQLWEQIVPFADYGFNASHACGYAFIAYQTAYLKAHHRVEYMAAMLTSVQGDKDKKPFYLNAARLMEIRVLPPDVNQSQLYFTPSNGEIRYGLAAVRNVGAQVVHNIIAARTEKGPFTSFTDFCRKVDSGVLHKKCVESLILSGAFDSLGYARRALLEGYEKVTTPILSERRAEAIGQESFFGGLSPALEIDESVLQGAEFEKPELLANEKEMLGQYVTDHPLLGIKDRLAAITDMEVSELDNLGDGDVVTVAGMVAAVARRYTRRGEPYALLRLEDLTGGISVVAFPGVFDKAADLIAQDRIVLVKGRADRRGGRGEQLQLVAIEISEPDVADTNVEPRAGVADPLIVDVPMASCTDGLIRQLKGLLSLYRGALPVIVQLVGEGEPTRLQLGVEFRVDGSSALLSELRRLFGRSSVRLEPEPAQDPAISGSTPVGAR
ncbi:MAG: DNA polymerase III subunit alpha, partial [Actinomycetota bacterium]